MRPVLENTLSQEKLPLKSLSTSPVCDLSSGADPYSPGLVAADAIDISCEISWMQMSGAALSSREGGGGERGQGEGGERVLCRDRVSQSVTEDQIDEQPLNTKGRFDQTAEKELLFCTKKI